MSQENNNQRGISRRDFLRASAAAGALTASGLAGAVPALADAAAQAPELEGRIVWDTFRGIGTGWNEERIETFQEMHPNVEIELRPVSGDNNVDRYTRMYVLEAAGDLGALHAWDPSHYQLRRAVSNDVLMPIDEFVETDGLDLGEWFDQFIAIQRFENQLYGLPSWGWAGFDTIVINAEKFAEAGLDLPDPVAHDTPMEEFAEWARIFRDEENGQWGLDIPMRELQITVMCRAFDSRFVNEEGTQCLILDDPNATEALRWAYNLIVEEQVIPFGDALGGNALSAMQADRLAMSWGGSLSVRNYKRAIDNPEVEAVGEAWQALFPTRESDGRFPTQIRGGTWNIHRNAENPQVAWEFMKHIAGFEGAVGFNLVAGQGALVRPDVMEALIEEDPIHEWFIPNLENGIPATEPANFRGAEYVTATEQFYSILMDPNDPIPFEEGLQMLFDAVQDVLDQDPV